MCILAGQSVGSKGWAAIVYIFGSKTAGFKRLGS